MFPQLPLRVRRAAALSALSFTIAPGPILAQQSPPPDSTPASTSAPATSSAPTSQPTLSADLLAGLKFRSLGPGLASGRIGDIAVHPQNRATWYIAVASGGVWKTVNGGTTFTPIFDSQGSYSIGCITLDPKNPNVVWVGTGENNSQRSVSWGDGVYRSRDGGKSWENLGLRDSEHIGMIEVHIHPVDPDTILASAYQRRRHVWTLINGGPESAIYKSTDAGATWNKLRAGLPTVEMGRIGIAISPVDSNVVYATVEAADRKGGIFRSQDRGATWERMNPFDATAMYYGVIVADPKNVDRIYIPNTNLMVSDDGGKTV